ncbi:MAG: Rrf2 family transcriptional regulator [Candidatus Moranbacteria bacterium]|nr:Rrf2 family transcriptional regulator [Candidatus Moranbacteria bacterium]
MHFSTKAEYGLKAVVNLAQCYPNQKTIKEIANQENISQKYLERLLGTLRDGEVIDSVKGKNGGYTLARDPKKITAGEVIEILDGSISPMRCVGKFCAMEKQCPSSIVWNKLGLQIQKTLYGIKLSDLIK